MNPSGPPDTNRLRLSTQQLRWNCKAEYLPFASTAQVDPADGIIGQDDAVEALTYGLRTNAPGQHIFVRGLTGTGRLSLVKRLVKSIQLSCPRVRDYCYVHNFAQPQRPRLISLEAGRGVPFRNGVDRMADFIRDELQGALQSEGVMVRRRALDDATRRTLKSIVEPLEKDLEQAGLTLVNVEAGPVTQTMVFPVVDGKAVPPEAFEQLHAAGDISDEVYKSVRDQHADFESRIADINEKAATVRVRHGEAVASLLEKSARAILEQMVEQISHAFPEEGVTDFLSEFVDDVVLYRLHQHPEEGGDFTRLYHVNVLTEHRGDNSCPIVVETSPSARNLVGTIEPDVQGDEVGPAHMGIRAGSILRANGGYLILEDREILRNRHAWRALKRTMRTGRLEISAPDMPVPGFAPAIKPEPIDIHFKVVLIGDPETYYLLDARDPDFPQLFKVLADFSDVIARDQTGVQQYASVLSRIVNEEGLPHFDRSGVAALAEHGARIAARNGQLTARFGRLADIAREAAFLAGENNECQEKDSAILVTDRHVHKAIERGKRRASMPARRFREYLADGTIQVETSGSVVGQVNGLAVLQAGPMTYGFPTRITATIGPGSAGVINIERESALSGAIHTKGFFILGGLLRSLLRTDHPLAFDASIAMEQSYGGIDGDSASGAEICCLLSALTDIPIRQCIAMTGAIDQHGHIMAIGAANEKIEGFYDACNDLGLTGEQGVIIPKSNAGDLMLRPDVCDACNQGSFGVFAVETVHDALEILTGISAGTRDENGFYAQGTVLHEAVQRAASFWQQAAPTTGAIKKSTS